MLESSRFASGPRTPPSRGQSALGARLLMSVALTLAGLELLASVLTPSSTPWLHAALVLVALDLSVSVHVTIAALRRGLTVLSSERPALSVLVAAWNEERDIVATVRSLLSQTGITLEVIVADDGSTDRTRELLIEAFGLTPVAEELRDADERVRVLSRPHAGKGAALEAARRAARHPILVTVDADTVVGPGALELLARPFANPLVEAVAGSVVIRRPSDPLSRFQYVEYLRTTFLRQGWSNLELLEQVPGAFAALRASAVEAAGGFPTDSLTEDYEVMFRLYERAASEGRRILVPTVVDACAYTEPPRTLAGLRRQRTRWFAGFLITLARFHTLILAPRGGTFSRVRLPLKVIDAIVPLWSLASLGSLAVLAAVSPADVRIELSGLATCLMALRATVDVAQTHLAFRAHARASSRIEALEPSLASSWAHALLDPWTYAWLRQVLVLRAYSFAMSRSTRWETSRPTAT